MTSNAKRIAVITAVSTLTAWSPGMAQASLLAPPGPWPAPVAGAHNPLIGTPFAFNGGHSTRNASLRVWLPYGRSHRATITRAIGGRIVVRGKLRNRDTRRSISGAALQLVEQNAAGGDWHIVGSAATNRRGRFRVVLPPGPSRRVAVLYWPDIGAPGPVFSRRLLVRSKARVYLRTAMRGRRITYRGRVSGAPIPPGGLLVAAQVANGRGWATVRLVRTLASGRFVARYRFNTAGRTFRVRALAPAQPAWPLYSGSSQTQRVRPR